MARARQAKTTGTRPIAAASNNDPHPTAAVVSDVAWVRAIPALGEIDDDVGLRVLAAAKPVTLPVGMTVFRAGDRCQDYLLVLDGSIRVQKLAESGREVVSRQLKEFERRGWVRLRRGEIAVLDAGALTRLVESAGV